jgi:predicted PurR-regulated permease PerM
MGRKSIMEHQIFEWVIAVAVLVVFMANMIFLALIYWMLKPLVGKLQATNDRINPILSELQGIISENRPKVSAMISDAQPVLSDIGLKADNIIGAVHDIVLSVKNQVELLDSIIGNVSDTIDETASIVQNRVIVPVREINYIRVAIKRAISTLFGKDSKTVS